MFLRKVDLDVARVLTVGNAALDSAISDTRLEAQELK